MTETVPGWIIYWCVHIHSQGKLNTSKWKNDVTMYATFLYENEVPGLEQATVVTMATRVLQPLKRAFLCIPPECLTTCNIWRGLKIFISQDVWSLQRIVLKFFSCSTKQGVAALTKSWYKELDDDRSCTTLETDDVLT